MRTSEHTLQDVSRLLAKIPGLAMTLLDVIELLSDEEHRLSDVLLKTKVLLSDLAAPELVSWINNELNGYAEEAELPPYRLIPTEVRGDVVSVAWQYQNYLLPIGHLTEQQRRGLETAEIRYGLPVIQEMCERTSSGDRRMRAAIPAECYGLLGKVLSEGVHINSAWCEMSPALMMGIPGQVRSRLLDFLLALRSEVGAETTDHNLKERSADLDIPGAFAGAMFGDNVTINFGHNSSQIVTNSVVSSVDQLFQRLALTGLPTSDIDDLKLAFEKDRESLGKPSFEGETGKWYQRLLSKAASGALKIGTNAVTGAIAAALTHYLASL